MKYIFYLDQREENMILNFFIYPFQIIQLSWIATKLRRKEMILS